jgi:prevent-host-death family protein
MRSMSAHDAKARFGQLLDAARLEPVTINKHGRAVAVVVSKEAFDAFEALKVEHLRTAVQKGIEAIERGDLFEVDTAGILQFGDAIKNEGRGRKKAE